MIEIGAKRWITTGSCPEEVVIAGHVEGRHRITYAINGGSHCYHFLDHEMYDTERDAMIVAIAENTSRMEQNTAENARLLVYNARMVERLKNAT